MRRGMLEDERKRYNYLSFLIINYDAPGMVIDN